MNPSSLVGDLVSVDTETTGANFFRDELLSLALVPMSSETCLVQNVELPVDATWTEYGARNFRKSLSDWRETAVSAAEAVDRVEAYLRRVFGSNFQAILVGHNVSFDRAFLVKLANRAGKESIRGISHRTIDTHSLLMILYLKGRIPKEALSSDGAFKHFGIVVSDEDRHTALGDAVATRSLFRLLLDEFSLV